MYKNTRSQVRINGVRSFLKEHYYFMPLHCNKSFLTHSWCENSIKRSLVKTKLHKNKDTQLEKLRIYCMMHFEIAFWHKMALFLLQDNRDHSRNFCLMSHHRVKLFLKYMGQLSFRCMKMKMLFQTSFHLMLCVNAWSKVPGIKIECILVGSMHQNPLCKESIHF